MFALEAVSLTGLWTQSCSVILSLSMKIALLQFPL